MENVLGFRCSDELKDRIDQLAGESGLSRSETVRKACEMYSEMKYDAVYDVEPEIFEKIQSTLTALYV